MRRRVRSFVVAVTSAVVAALALCDYPDFDIEALILRFTAT